MMVRRLAWLRLLPRWCGSCLFRRLPTPHSGTASRWRGRPATPTDRTSPGKHTDDDPRGGGGGGAVGPVDLTGDIVVRPVLVVKVDIMPASRVAQFGSQARDAVRGDRRGAGSVESVEVVSSTNPMFNDAAVDAVRRWRYRPALMNGRPVRVYFSVVVDFLVR